MENIFHLLDRVLPQSAQRHGLVLFELYLDENGDDGGFPSFCFGGVRDQLQSCKAIRTQMEERAKACWGAVFHMVDCAHGAAHYKDMSLKERIKHEKRLIALINEHVQFGIVGMTPLNRGVESENVPLVDCAQASFAMLSAMIDQSNRRLGLNAKTAVFYELGHKHSNQAIQHFNDHEYDNIISVSGMKKTEAGMLQAADLLVWQYSKYVKDLKSGRPPRKDFLALTEKPLAFVHIWKEESIYNTFGQYDDSDLDSGDCRKFLEQLYFTNKNFEEIIRSSNAYAVRISSIGSLRDMSPSR